MDYSNWLKNVHANNNKNTKQHLLLAIAKTAAAATLAATAAVETTTKEQFNQGPYKNRIKKFQGFSGCFSREKQGFPGSTESFTIQNKLLCEHMKATEQPITVSLSH